MDAHELICVLHGLPKRMRPKMRADVDAVFDKEPFCRFEPQPTIRAHLGRVLRVPMSEVDTLQKLIDVANDMTETLAPNNMLKLTAEGRAAEIAKRAPLVHRRITSCLDGTEMSRKRGEALRVLVSEGVNKVDIDTIARIYELALAIQVDEDKHDESANVSTNSTSDAAANTDPLEEGLASSDDEKESPESV